MYTIYSYHNVSTLSGLLNAVAAMSGSDDYRSALAMMAAIGCMVAMFAYALAPQKLYGWQWLASVTLVLSALFVPKSEVQVVDVTDEAPPRVIGNVPYALAFLAGASSTLGHTLTQLVETTFQTIPPDSGAALPAELSYERNGLVFGARLMTTVQKTVFGNPSFRADMVNFIGNCVEPDIASGHLSLDTIGKSTDLWVAFNGTNPARMTTLMREARDPLIVTCPDAYTNLDARMPEQVANATLLVATSMHPGPLRDKVARTMAELGVSLETYGLTSAGTDAAGFIRHAALLGAVYEAGNVSASRVGDSTALMLSLARAQAFVKTNSSFINNAKIAEQALPVVRNVIEALAFVLFPFVVLLMLLGSGKDAMMAFKNYASLLIWIQLWPPLYAVLNYMTSVYARQEMVAAATMQTSELGLTLSTTAAISSAGLTSQAIAGYLIWSIPVIAWAALKRMENLGTTLAGALTQLGQLSSSGTGTAMNGNAGLGSMSFDQVNASPNMSSPFVRSMQDGLTGTTKTRTGNGREWESQMMNHGAVKDTVEINLGQLRAKRAAAAVTAAKREVQGASMREGEALARTLTHLKKVGRNDNASTGRNENVGHSAGSAVNSVDSFVDSALASAGVAKTEKTRAGFLAALSLAWRKMENHDYEVDANGRPIMDENFMRELALSAAAGTDWGDGRQQGWVAAVNAIKSGQVSTVFGALRTIANQDSQTATNSDGHETGRSTGSEWRQAREVTAMKSADLTNAISFEESATSSTGMTVKTTVDVGAASSSTFKGLNPGSFDGEADAAQHLLGFARLTRHQREQFLSDQANAALDPVQTPVFRAGETVVKDANSVTQQHREDAANLGAPELTRGQREYVAKAKVRNDGIVEGERAASLQQDAEGRSPIQAPKDPGFRKPGDDDPQAPQAGNTQKAAEYRVQATGAVARKEVENERADYEDRSPGGGHNPAVVVSQIESLVTQPAIKAAEKVIEKGKTMVKGKLGVGKMPVYPDSPESVHESPKENDKNDGH